MINFGINECKMELKVVHNFIRISDYLDVLKIQFELNFQYIVIWIIENSELLNMQYNMNETDFIIFINYIEVQTKILKLELNWN